MRSAEEIAKELLNGEFSIDGNQERIIKKIAEAIQKAVEEAMKEEWKNNMDHCNASIAQERERAAKIAEEHNAMSPHNEDICREFMGPSCDLCSWSIAAAIREGKA
jgi:hypothetical protein